MAFISLLVGGKGMKVKKTAAFITCVMLVISLSACNVSCNGEDADLSIRVGETEEGEEKVTIEHPVVPSGNIRPTPVLEIQEVPPLTGKVKEMYTFDPVYNLALVEVVAPDGKTWHIVGVTDNHDVGISDLVIIHRAKVVNKLTGKEEILNTIEEIEPGNPWDYY